MNHRPQGRGAQNPEQREDFASVCTGAVHLGEGEVLSEAQRSHRAGQADDIGEAGLHRIRAHK